MLVCTILYMVESMSLGGLEAVFRVEFLRLTLEYPWDVGPLPTSAATTTVFSGAGRNGGLPVGDNLIPAVFFQINL